MALTAAKLFFSKHKSDHGRQVELTVVPCPGEALIFLHEWWHEGQILLEGRQHVLRTDVPYRISDSNSIQTCKRPQIPIDQDELLSDSEIVSFKGLPASAVIFNSKWHSPTISVNETQSSSG